MNTSKLQNITTRLITIGEWLIVGAIAFALVPMIWNVFAVYSFVPWIKPDIVQGVLFPAAKVALILGTLVMVPAFLTKVFSHRLHTAETLPLVQERSHWSLIPWNVISLMVSFAALFPILFIGGMAGDSGTTQAYVTGVVIQLLGIGYVVLTMVGVYLSHKKRSLAWAVLPALVPPIVLWLVLFVVSLIW